MSPGAPYTSTSADGAPLGPAGPPTARLRLDLGYDGTDFSGWAAQPDQRTVAGVLLGALGQLFGPDGATGLTVSGRTDAGVHATGQVCHIDANGARWEALRGSLVRRLCRLLPLDVRVFEVVEVPVSFDARFSAVYRRYEYRISDAEYGTPPLRHRDTVAWPRPLEPELLNAASAALVGEHDFAAYCRHKENATTIRAIRRFTWHRDADGIILATVEADAFCQAMVRGLVGALLPVGDGRRPVSWPASLLARRERANEITVAPAHGLTLVAVGYPDDRAEYGHRAAQTRRLRGPAASE